MTAEEVAVKLEDHEHEIGSLKHRMKEAEASNKVLTELATSVKVMATKQDAVIENVDKLNSKVDNLEAKPGKRWDGLVEKLLYLAAGAFISWLSSGAPGL